MSRSIRRAIVVAFCATTFLLPATGVLSTIGAAHAAPRAQGALQIKVVDGEDGVNIIDKKTAVKPVVEIRDKNNLPVAGATVVFFIQGGARTATFANGAAQVTVTTNAQGLATVTQLNPIGRGAYEIGVRASYQGETATATIHQANFANAAQAAQAGKAPSTSSGGSGGSGSAGASGGAGGGAGAGAGTAAAGAAAGGAAAGGLSAGVIGGIVGGAVAGGIVTAKAISNKPTPNTKPVVGGITATPVAALLGTNTPVAFSAPGSDADNDPLTYSWDFGDGGTGTGGSTSHVFTAAGTFTVKVTVSDGKDTATNQTTFVVKTLSGNWRYSDSTGSITFTFTQSGSSFSGPYVSVYNVPGIGAGSYPGTITNGTIRAAQPQISFTYFTAQWPSPPCPANSGIVATLSGNPGADVNTITGTSSSSIGACPAIGLPGTSNTGPFTLTRQ
jgi:hypothetical protein